MNNFFGRIYYAYLGRKDQKAQHIRRHTNWPGWASDAYHRGWWEKRYK